MILVTPDERFDTAAGFAPASFCENDNVSSPMVQKSICQLLSLLPVIVMRQPE